MWILLSQLLFDLINLQLFCHLNKLACVALDSRSNDLDHYFGNFEFLAGQLKHKLDKLLFHGLFGASFDIGIESFLLQVVQALIDLFSAL